MDDLAWKLLLLAIGALGVVVWWLYQRHDKRIDSHDREFIQVRREVNTELASLTGETTITRIERTWTDKLESMQREIDMRHQANEGRFNRIDDKLDTIIEKLMGRP